MSALDLAPDTHVYGGITIEHAFGQERVAHLACREALEHERQENRRLSARVAELEGALAALRAGLGEESSVKP